MTPELQEACARRAYEIYAVNNNEPAAWGAVQNKSIWLDGVRDHELHPEAIQRKGDPNMQERCIMQACRELNQPTARQPLVIPPVSDENKPKGAKTK